MSDRRPKGAGLNPGFTPQAGTPGASPTANNAGASDGAPVTLAPPPGPRALTDQDVVKLWEEFKAGNVAPCPRDEAPLALAVDGAAKSYRLVCTRCGNASPWFEIGATGLHVRSPDELAGPNHSDD